MIKVAIHDYTSHSCKSCDTVYHMCCSFAEVISYPHKFSEFIDLVAVAGSSVVGMGYAARVKTVGLTTVIKGINLVYQNKRGSLIP